LFFQWIRHCEEAFSEKQFQHQVFKLLPAILSANAASALTLFQQKIRIILKCIGTHLSGLVTLDAARNKG
jgi:hypothetical protein